MWLRALQAEEGSLVREAYLMLRRDSINGCKSKYNWCTQLKRNLNSLGLLGIWERASINEVKGRMGQMIRKWVAQKRTNDLAYAQKSTSAPHYYELKRKGRRVEPFLNGSLSRSLASCFAQVCLCSNWCRLAGQTVLLGGFYVKCSCTLDPHTLFHLLADCPNLSTKRTKYLPEFLDMNFDLFNYLNYDVSQSKCLRLYLFLGKALRVT